MTSYELCVKPDVGEVPLLIEWVESCCGDEGVADDSTFKMTLSVEEAVMNVIDHAFLDLPPPHSIKVRLDITDESIAAEIIDNGHPYDPRTAPDPDLGLPLEERRPGGLGVHLMRSMMDRLDYRCADGRNIFRLEKSRS